MPTIYKPKPTPRSRSEKSSERHDIYNTRRWMRLRKVKFTNSPLCEMCYGEGAVVPAEDIHHITSFMTTDDMDRRKFLAYDYSNLMSLCKVCHQKIHNQ